MTWLYAYILADNWPRYRAEGWTLCGRMYPLAGWESVIVRKRA